MVFSCTNLKKNAKVPNERWTERWKEKVAGSYGEKWLWISRVNNKYETKVWFFLDNLNTILTTICMHLLRLLLETEIYLKGLWWRYSWLVTEKTFGTGVESNKKQHYNGNFGASNFWTEHQNQWFSIEHFELKASIEIFIEEVNSVVTKKSVFEYGCESIKVANFGTVAPSRFWWEYRRQGFLVKSSSACIDLSLEILMNENKPVMVDKVEVEQGNEQKKQQLLEIWHCQRSDGTMKPNGSSIGSARSIVKILVVVLTESIIPLVTENCWFDHRNTSRKIANIDFLELPGFWCTGQNR